MPRAPNISKTMLLALAHLKTEFIRECGRGERGYYVSATTARRPCKRKREACFIYLVQGFPDVRYYFPSSNAFRWSRRCDECGLKDSDVRVLENSPANFVDININNYLSNQLKSLNNPIILKHCNLFWESIVWLIHDKSRLNVAAENGQMSNFTEGRNNLTPTLNISKTNHEGN